MELEVNGRKVQIKEIGYLEALTITELSDTDRKEMMLKLIELSTDLSREEIEKLTMKEGVMIQKAVNEINDLQGFQGPLKEENQS